MNNKWNFQWNSIPKNRCIFFKKSHYLLHPNIHTIIFTRIYIYLYSLSLSLSLSLSPSLCLTLSLPIYISFVCRLSFVLIPFIFFKYAAFFVSNNCLHCFFLIYFTRPPIFLVTCVILKWK